MLNINPRKETEKIVSFIQKILNEQKIEKAVIGLSGGIDSTVSLYLLKKAIEPKNIIVLHLPYSNLYSDELKKIIKNLKIPEENFKTISIKKAVDNLSNQLFHLRGDSPELAEGHGSSEVDRTRLGNIMARIRMIILYDFAKKHQALVCGTENKSEHLLGYYTRFGDEASDFEPIKHLYKIQVFELASFLGVPKSIIEQKPTAGLWQNQTDEDEFGFFYQEADHVLYLCFEKKMTVKQIKKEGFKNAEKIINFALKNSYKHQTPYSNEEHLLTKNTWDVVWLRT